MSVAAIRWWRRAKWWCTWPPLVSWWRWRPTNRINLAQGAGRAERFGRFGCSVFCFGPQCGAASGGGLSKKCYGNEVEEMMVPIPHLRRGRDDVRYPRCPVSFLPGFWVLGLSYVNWRSPRVLGDGHPGFLILLSGQSFVLVSLCFGRWWFIIIFIFSCSYVKGLNAFWVEVCGYGILVCQFFFG